MLGDLIPVMTGVAMAGRYLGQKRGHDLDR